MLHYSLVMNVQKTIIQAGITEVIYLSDKYKDTDIVKASKFMFDKANVKYRYLGSNRENLLISFNPEDV